MQHLAQRIVFLAAGRRFARLIEDPHPPNLALSKTLTEDLAMVYPDMTFFILGEIYDDRHREARADARDAETSEADTSLITALIGISAVLALVATEILMGGA